jgi:uncharacterized membrane protein YidH (DUF202 family)
MNRYVDTGVGNERTSLAWQRTALSIVACAAILTRLTSSALGIFSLVSLAIGLAVALWLFVEGRARYRHRHGHSIRRRARSGLAPLALMLAALVLGGTELAALLVH